MKPFRIARRKAAAPVVAAVAVAVVVAVAALAYGLYANVTTSGEISSMSTTVSSQSERIVALQSTVGSLQNNVTSLQNKLVAVGSQLNSTESTVGSLRANVTSLQNEVNLLRGQLNSTQAKLSLVSAQLNSTQATVVSLRGNVTILQNKLILVSGELNSTQATDSAALLRLSAEVQSLNATVQALTQQLTSLASPALLQQAESTCSYVCASGSTNATFSSNVRKGDMLVITIVSDDLTNLIVTDSLGTRISLAVSATTSPSCTSNTGTCQANIYWGLFPSSGPDKVYVSEGASPRALRVQMWEFTGVNSVQSTVSCAPSCGSTSYPSSGILIATARDVTGAGAGFSWYPYAASGVAGSEYLVIAGPGSTTFPFSTSVNDVEVGAVLVSTP